MCWRRKMEQLIEKNIRLILDTIIKVVTNPVGFFKDMPKSGGFIEPLVFMVSMGVVAGIIQAVFGIIGLTYAASFVTALTSIIIVPIAIAIFGFVSAGILFIIWKIMGSQESFETAYRCGAYTGAIVPITMVVGSIPYLGTIIGLAWTTYLFVIASIEVHKLNPKVSWIVFGAIGLLFSLISISSQYTARSITTQMGSFGGKMENMKDMTPEEAGRAMGEFLKGIDKGAKEE